ncbi:MAG: hypothetical protein ACM359_20060 [Bacillota bacterium]
MPRGSSPKRERECDERLGKFRKSGRYKGHRKEKEVAARICNKQRAQYGQTKGEQQNDREGKSPECNLPIKDYQELTIGQIKQKLRLFTTTSPAAQRLQTATRAPEDPA